MTTTQDILEFSSAAASWARLQLQNNDQAHRITLIPGEGIGPEITAAATRAVDATGVSVVWETVALDSRSIAASGGNIPPAIFDVLRKNRVALKGPVFEQSPNAPRTARAALRERLGLFISYRRIRSIPGVASLLPNVPVDIAIFQENQEGLYSGIGQLAALGVVDSLEFVARTVSLRIADAAFAFVRREGRKRVTAVHHGFDANEMLFLNCCQETARSLRHLQYDELLSDEAARLIPEHPDKFDVILAPSHFGDRLADLCSFLVGGVALLPTADLGEAYAVFSSLQRSSPDSARGDSVNPTGSIQAAALLLEHIGERDAALRLRRALCAVYANGRHLTPDFGGNASTSEFTNAVVAELGPPG